MPCEDGATSSGPTLTANPCELEPYEISRSSAIIPTGRDSSSVLECRAACPRTGRQRRGALDRPPAEHRVGGQYLADGRLVVAAYDDGTIRWHRMDDGRELWPSWSWLTERTGWPDRGRLLRRHPGRPWRAEMACEPRFCDERRKRCRFPNPLASPADALALVLQRWRPSGPLNRRSRCRPGCRQKQATGMSAAPGANLHVLAIGVATMGRRQSNST